MKTNELGKASPLAIALTLDSLLLHYLHIHSPLLSCSPLLQTISFPWLDYKLFKGTHYFRFMQYLTHLHCKFDPFNILVVNSNPMLSNFNFHFKNKTEWKADSLVVKVLSMILWRLQTVSVRLGPRIFKSCAKSNSSSFRIGSVLCGLQMPFVSQF